MATSVIDSTALASTEGGKGKGKLRPPPPPKAKAKPKATANQGYEPQQAAWLIYEKLKSTMFFKRCVRFLIFVPGPLGRLRADMMLTSNSCLPCQSLQLTRPGNHRHAVA